MAKKRLPTGALGPTPKSNAVDAVEFGASMLPVFGGALQKMLNQFVQDRGARIEHFLARLNAKLVEAGVLGPEDQLSDDDLKSLGIDPDLLVAGLTAAAAARTEERIDQICAILASGFAAGHIGRNVAERLIEILADLDDEAVVILCSFHPSFKHNAEFQKLHGDLAYPPHIDEESTMEEMTQASNYRLYVEQLKKHGLVFEPGGFGGGMPDNPTYELTSIGSEFLQATRLADTPALRFGVQRKFAEQVLHAYESLRDSAQNCGEEIDSRRAEFLGFHPKRETHYIAYCEELYAEHRWESLRPKAENAGLVGKLGLMARLYKHVVDKFEVEKGRDYRDSPLTAQEIYITTYEVTEALGNEGVEFSDGF